MKEDSIKTLHKDMVLLGKMITEKKQVTTYQFAKRNFAYTDFYDLRKKEAFVRAFLERWQKYNIIKCYEVDGTKYFSVDLSKVIFGQTKTKIGKRAIKMGFSIAVNIDSKWVLYTL